MMERLARSSVGLCLVVAAACDGNHPVAPTARVESLPPTGPVYTSLEMRPASVELYSTSPGNSVLPIVLALDSLGKPIAEATTVYATSAPEVAQVSDRGVVSAISPGSAIITASVTVAGLTRTASMTVAVRDRVALPAQSPLAGVYDLTSLVVHYDPAWGSIERGSVLTAVLAIEHSDGALKFVGRFSNFCYADAQSKECSWESGTVRGKFLAPDHVTVDLTFDGSESAMWSGRGTFDKNTLSGTYWTSGSIDGTFVAVRRAGK